MALPPAPQAVVIAFDRQGPAGRRGELLAYELVAAVRGDDYPATLAEILTEALADIALAAHFCDCLAGIAAGAIDALETETGIPRPLGAGPEWRRSRMAAVE